jgi:hypothetical protein
VDEFTKHRSRTFKPRVQSCDRQVEPPLSPSGNNPSVSDFSRQGGEL